MSFNVREIRERLFKYDPSANRFFGSELTANTMITPLWANESSFVYIKEIFKENKKEHEYILHNIKTGIEKKVYNEEELSNAMKNCFKIDKDGLLTAEFIRIEENRIIFDTDAASLGFLCRFCYFNNEIKLISPRLPKNSRISPDEKCAVYEKDGNIFSVDFATGDSRKLTSKGTSQNGYGVIYAGSQNPVAMQINGYEPPCGAVWSPDNIHVFLQKTSLEGVKTISLIRNVPDEDKAVRPDIFTYQYAFPLDSIVPTATYHILNIKTGKIFDLPIEPTYMNDVGLCSGDAGTYGWSDCGKYAICYWQNRAVNEIKIYVTDIENMKTKLLFTENSDTFIGNNWYNGDNDFFMGGSPVSRRRFYAYEEMDTLFWWRENNNGFDLYGYSISNGEMKRLTKEKTVRQILYCNVEKNELILSISNIPDTETPYQKKIVKLSLDSLSITPISFSLGMHEAHVLPGGKYIVESVSSIDTPTENRITDIDGNLISNFAKCDYKRLIDAGFSYPKVFCEKGADNKTDIYGIIVLPKDFNPNKKYPIVEDYYGGNMIYTTPQRFSENFEFQTAFSELGFIYIKMDGRGTPMRGKKFHDTYCYNDLGSVAGLPDHCAVIEKLCEKYSYIDKNKIGVWGVSGGGFAALHCLVDRGDLYKCAVSGCGNHSQELYCAEWGEQFMGSDDPEYWKKQDSEWKLENLKGKLMLVHGDIDGNVHNVNTMRIVNKLIKQDKDFEMFIIPNWGHNLSDNPFFQRKMLEFFLNEFQKI